MVIGVARLFQAVQSFCGDGRPAPFWWLHNIRFVKVYFGKKLIIVVDGLDTGIPRVADFAEFRHSALGILRRIKWLETRATGLR
jgi:hypothetical protein